MTNKKLPEFLFAVADADGNMLGHVSYAHGIFRFESDAIEAAGRHFRDVSHNSNLQIRSLPVEGIQVATQPPVNHDEVLVDVLYAADCCGLTLAELPLASHTRDAEVTCQYCHSTFRYVWDDETKRLIWRCRLPQSKTRRDEIIKTLGEVIVLIKKDAAYAEADTEADTEADEESQQSPTWGPWGKDGRPEGGLDCG